MANNDKLKQIISNLQVLTDLTKSMIDAEMYPVSFFSQAFDLTNKIQSDIQTLESDQVEMFAAQMKKHQALILSIHQQMRNISPETAGQKPATPDAIDRSAVPNAAPEQPTARPATTPKQEIAESKETNPKKGSFLNRLGIYKEDKKEAPDKEQKPVTPAKKQNDTPAPTIRTEKQSPVIEEPIRVPEKKTVIEPKPVVAPKPTVVPKPAAEPKPIVEPKPTDMTRPTRPMPTHEAAPEPTKRPTTKPVEAIPPAVEINPPPSIKDVIERKKLSDLRKAFSLNDRFLYRRELFGGSEDAMNKAITILNGKESFKDSVDFLEHTLYWDFNNPTVKSFIKILEIRFL